MGSLSEVSETLEKLNWFCFLVVRWNYALKVWTFMKILFTSRRDIASCPWTNQSHLGRCSNEKLRFQLCWMTEPSEVQPISQQHSAILIMLKYHENIILKDYENIHGGNSGFTTLKFSGKIYFHFHLQLCKNILEWLLSYEVISFNLQESVINHCQNKYSKDFITITGFLRSLLKVKNKKLDQIMSNC